MKKYTILFSAIISSIISQAQTSVKLPGDILSLISSADGSRVAVSTADSIYVFASRDLLLHGKWAHGKQAAALMEFHPWNNNLVILQQQNINHPAFYGASLKNSFDHYQEYERKWLQHPYDSVSMWNVKTGKAVNAMPGNYFVQFGKSDSQYVVAANEIYSFTGTEGRKLWGSRKTELRTNDSGFEFSSIIRKACRRILLSPVSDVLAASWYGGLVNDKSSYSFSLLDFKTHQAVISIDTLTSPPGDFCFSKKGELLAVAMQNETNIWTITVIDVKGKKVKQQIRELKNPRDLRFSAAADELYFLTDNREWVAWNLKSNMITQKIWSGLTGLNSMEAAVLAGSNLVVTGSGWAGQPFNSPRTYLLNTVNRAGLEVFSKVEQGSTDSYSDSLSFTMIMNDIALNNNSPVLRFSTNRSILARVEKTQLQIWNTKFKKKLTGRNFEKDIKAFPDHAGNNILVIEQKGQLYGEFTLHTMRTVNSTIKTSNVLKEGKGVMRGTGLYCDCVAEPLVAASWYCVDGSEKIWKVNGNDFTTTSVATVEGLDLREIQFNERAELFVSGQTRNEAYQVWSVPKNADPVQVMESTGSNNMQVAGEEVWVWRTGYNKEDSVASAWKKGVNTRKLEANGRITKIDAAADGSELMIQYEVKNEIFVQRARAGIGLTPHNTKLISGTFYMLENDQLFLDKEGFFSYFDKAAIQLPWSVSTPRVLDNINFDVSPNGNFILFANRIIDLKEINQWNLDEFEKAALLDDKEKLSWISIHEEAGYGKDRAGFTLYKYVQGKNDTIKSKTWIKNPDKNKAFYFNHDMLITSPDRPWAISYTQMGMMNKGELKAAPILWNLSNMEGKSLSEKFTEQTPSFSADSKTFSFHNWEWNEKKEVSIFHESVFAVNPLKLVSSSTGKTPGIPGPGVGEMFTTGLQWMVPDGDSMKVRKTFYSRDGSAMLKFSPENNKLVASTSAGNLVIWDINGSTSPLAVVKAHSSTIQDMQIRGNRLYTMSESGEIAITDLRENKLTVQFKTLMKEGEIRVAIITPEGYYRVDPDLMSDLHFVRNGQVFPLSSFELQGNRPDKVYAAIGLSDSSLITALKQSWETRVKRAGFDPAIKIDEAKRPNVKWNRDKLPLVTTDTILHLDMIVSDRSDNIKSIYITVNGVPISSKKGLAVNKSREISLQPKVLLSEGSNNISVTAVNEKGIESVEELFSVHCSPASPRPRRLFYLGVGVSQYADSSMNLQYAARDAEEIAKYLENWGDTTVLITRTNAQATRENILSLKKLLGRTNTEDVVILSFSGHGMVEKDKGFFFAPHEMDFTNPSAHGISMEMIEDLLDDIPARKRLLLLDACHSGEDWNTGETGPLPPGVKTRGLIVKSGKNAITQANRNSYLLMKELFSDFSRGNGAFMISAAANNEFAFEGEKWNNGVFTMSFLESLWKLRYEQSWKGKQPVKMRELRKMIYKQVSLLTNGLQNPTSRQENGWWNWSL